MSVLLLHRIVRLAFHGLQPYDELVLMGSKLKIHRGMDGLRVQDMSNAGKRGKMAPNFYLDWGPWNPDKDIVTGIIEPILDANSYAQALQIAKALVEDIHGQRYPNANDPLNWGNDTAPMLSLREGYVKGIELAPLGSVVELKTSKFILKATPREFSLTMIVTGQQDQYLGRIDTPTGTKRVYEWLKQDGSLDKLQGLTFTQVVSLVKAETGIWIAYH